MCCECGWNVGIEVVVVVVGLFVVCLFVGIGFGDYIWCCIVGIDGDVGGIVFCKFWMC